MKKTTIQITIHGTDLHPDSTRARDLARLVTCVESAVGALTAKSADEDPVLVSLVGIGDGSNRLKLAIARHAVPALVLISQCVASGEYGNLNSEAHSQLYSIYQQARDNNWSVVLGAKKSLRIRGGTISVKHPVPQRIDERLVRGTTTIFGRCLRIGGVEPKAEIRQLDGALLHVEVSEPIARQLASSLYENVQLHGVAEWDPSTWEIRRFSVTAAGSIATKSPALAFAHVRTASRGGWDGIDVLEAVSRLRHSETA